MAGLDQLEATQRRVIRLMRGSVKAQVADMVLDEADRYGAVHLSQASVAGPLGASRQSVNQSLSESGASGAVETGYRVITIADRDRLPAVTGR